MARVRTTPTRCKQIRQGREHCILMQPAPNIALGLVALRIASGLGADPVKRRVTLFSHVAPLCGESAAKKVVVARGPS